MKRVIFSILLIVVGVLGSLSRGDVEPPPAKYASGPFLVQPTYIIVKDPDKTCQKLARIPNERYQACSIPALGYIYLPRDDGSRWWKKLKAHEEAHLRGWRHK